MTSTTTATTGAGDTSPPGPAPAGPGSRSEPSRMPISAHLSEARSRAFRAALAFVAAVVAGFITAPWVMDLLREPIEQIAQTRNASVNYDSVTGAFDLRMRIAMFTAVALSSPVWIYQLLAYLSPGLTRRERRYTLGFFFAALPLFLGGCAMGFWIFPHMVELLTSFAAQEDSTILQATTYVDFVMKVILATGVAFVLPVALVMLNFLGILPARTIARTWRFSVVGIVVFAGLVTPAADVLSMFLVAVPMAALFGAALLISFWHDRRTGRLTQRPTTATGTDTSEVT